MPFSFMLFLIKPVTPVFGKAPRNKFRWPPLVVGIIRKWTHLSRRSQRLDSLYCSCFLTWYEQRGQSLLSLRRCDLWMFLWSLLAAAFVRAPPVFRALLVWLAQ